MENININQPSILNFVKNWSNQSSKVISSSVWKFIANFFKRIVTKRGQKLILGDNFINKNSDDVYVLHVLCFYEATLTTTLII